MTCKCKFTLDRDFHCSPWELKSDVSERGQRGEAWKRSGANLRAGAPKTGHGSSQLLPVRKKDMKRIKEMMRIRDRGLAGTVAGERKVFVYGHGLQPVGDGKRKDSGFYGRARCPMSGGRCRFSGSLGRRESGVCFFGECLTMDISFGTVIRALALPVFLFLT